MLGTSTEAPIVRKIRVELEVKNGKYVLVLSAPDIETVRHPFDTEEEARAALQRGFDAIGTIPSVTGVDTTDAAKRFLAGEPLKQ